VHYTQQYNGSSAYFVNALTDGAEMSGASGPGNNGAGNCDNIPNGSAAKYGQGVTSMSSPNTTSGVTYPIGLCVNRNGWTMLWSGYVSFVYG
jgi:hypothetical protein